MRVLAESSHPCCNHNSILALHAQRAELRFLLSWKCVVQRALSSKPCINPPMWTQSPEFTLVHCDHFEFAMIIWLILI